MTIYDIKNIEHCDVREIGNPAIGYIMKSHDGWWIHIFDGDPISNKIYKKSIAPNANMDFSLITILHESELPPDAELCAEVSNEEQKRIESYRLEKLNRK